jgi:hypothetical protein
LRRVLKTISILAVSATLIHLSHGSRVAHATGGAFPLTKHGGGSTDAETPFDAGSGPGVDRSINPDYGGGYYNSNNPEAGRHRGGECVQCHEPHASFGGAEAPPVNFTPQNYLLFNFPSAFMGDYAELCWYCHENFTNINGSGSPPGMGRWGFYQGKAVFQASSHFQSGSFYWPGAAGDPVTIWPRQSRAALPIGNTGSCLNCHTPHGIKEQPGFELDTTAVPTSPTNLHLSANNASVSADNLVPRQLIAWEEALCENCHDASGPSTVNIQDEINKRSTGGSGHPVDDTAIAGRHTLAEATPVTAKHVECYDCHNPHAVKAPTGVPGDGDGGRIKGTKYVDISGAVQNPATAARQPYIYEVCLKCHGNSYYQVFASDNPFPDVVQDRQGNTGHYSNKRKEFDPTSHQYANYPQGDLGYNTAYHPVASPGRNGTMALCYQLQNAFTPALDCSSDANASATLQNLTINCTDCHNSEQTAPALTNPVTVMGPVTESSLRWTDRTSLYAPSTSPVGPHGSARNRLLRGNYLTTNSTSGAIAANWYANNRLDTNGRPKFELCFFCHDESRILYTGGGATYGTNFGGNTIAWNFDTWSANLHQYHLNAQAVCHDCHHNVHSNVEAQNTIYGNGFGGQLPPDSHDSINDGRVDTHLMNFGPQASGQTAAKPRWYWDGTYFRCNLYCHGFTMSLCYYTHGSGGTLTGWCA